MKKIVFFNLNRINFQGGAEKYLIDLGNKLTKRGVEISYIGDCKLCQKIFILVNFLLSDSSLKKLFNSYRSLSTKEAFCRINFNVVKITLRFLIPASSLRKKIEKII